MNTTPTTTAVRQGGAVKDGLTVLHILAYQPIGTRTMDEFLLKFIDGIRERGWHAAFVFSGEPTKAFHAELCKREVEYFVARFPLSWSTTCRIVRKFLIPNPAIVVTSFLSTFTMPILFLKLFGFARRLVVIDHSSGVASPKIGFRRLLARWRGRIAGWLVDRILPVSEANARRDIEGVFLPARKVRRIYNGIALERFHPTKNRAAGPLRIAYAGQLIPEKGVLTLLQAFRNLPEETELTIAGQGPQEPELRAYCHNAGLDRVRFVGHISTVAGLFAGSDVVVVPSEWNEAFGLVAAEAMASGAAVIVSDAGGLPEVVGNEGLVFQRGNSVDLENQLRRLIESPELRSDLSKRGRKRAVEQFSIDRCVADRLAILDELTDAPF